MECRLHTHVPFEKRDLVIGEIVWLHVRDGIVDPQTLRVTADTRRSAGSTRTCTRARAIASPSTRTRTSRRCGVWAGRDSPPLACGRPVLHPDPRDDAESVARRLDDRGLALGEIGRTGDRVERVAVAHDHVVRAARGRCDSSLRSGATAPDRRAAPIRRVPRTSSRRGRTPVRPSPPSGRTGSPGLSRSEFRARGSRRRSCVRRASAVDEIALGRAVVETLHAGVVLRHSVAA